MSALSAPCVACKGAEFLEKRAISGRDRYLNSDFVLLLHD